MAHYPLYTQNLSLVGVCVKRIGKDFSKVLLALEEKYEVRIPDEDMESLETVNILAAYIRDKMV